MTDDNYLNEKLNKHTAWSEDFRRGYQNGFNAGKAHWQSEMKKALVAKDRERVNLLKIYPYNLIPIITGEDDISYLRSDAGEENEEPMRYYSPGIIEDVMHKALTEREDKVLQMRYEWGLTLDQAGAELGITRERVRQIENKALRKLNYRTHLHELECVPKKDLMEAQSQVENYKAQADYLQRELDRIRGIVPAQREEAEQKGTLLETPIENLDLSVRSYNCLKRAGIQALGDLCGKTYTEMMKVRNLGKRSLAEIEDKMKENGLRFRPETDHE